jgi:hypothetical protein
MFLLMLARHKLQVADFLFFSFSLRNFFIFSRSMDNTTLQRQIQVLLEELIFLQGQYSNAVQKDSILAIKKEIRMKIKEVQVRLTELSAQLGSTHD